MGVVEEWYGRGIDFIVEHAPSQIAGVIGRYAAKKGSEAYYRATGRPTDRELSEVVHSKIEIVESRLETLASGEDGSRAIELVRSFTGKFNELVEKSSDVYRAIRGLPPNVQKAALDAQFRDQLAEALGHVRGYLDDRFDGIDLRLEEISYGIDSSNRKLDAIVDHLGIEVEEVRVEMRAELKRTEKFQAPPMIIGNLEIEGEHSQRKKEYTYEESLARLRKAGYQRHPTPCEMIDYIRALKRAGHNLSGEYFTNLSVEVRGSRMFCYVGDDDPSNSQSDFYIDISGMPIGEIVTIGETDEDFIRKILGNNLGDFDEFWFSLNAGKRIIVETVALNAINIGGLYLPKGNSMGVREVS